MEKQFDSTEKRFMNLKMLTIVELSKPLDRLGNWVSIYYGQRSNDGTIQGYGMHKFNEGITYYGEYSGNKANGEGVVVNN